jgi:hypothetical protein
LAAVADRRAEPIARYSILVTMRIGEPLLNTNCGLAGRDGEMARLRCVPRQGRPRYPCDLHHAGLPRSWASMLAASEAGWLGIPVLGWGDDICG